MSLVDALYYATTEFKPKTVVDVATLTGFVNVLPISLYTYAPGLILVIAL